MRKNIVFGLAAMLALVFSGQAVAQSNKKGPRASLDVKTVCSLCLDEEDVCEGTAEFRAEIRVRDKTSGDAVAVVDQSTLTAVAKKGAGPWKPDNTETLAVNSETDDREINPSVDYTVINELAVNICSGIDGYTTLNAFAEVTYGHLVDISFVEDNTVNNRCSDDPHTYYITEPSGIHLDSATKAAISAACP